MKTDVSKQALQRMPYYLQHLRKMLSEGKKEVSAPFLAKEFGFTEVQVRKDLACVSSVQGKAKVGFNVSSLIVDIEDLLDYKHSKKAVIVGYGQLGHALMGFTGFSEYGIDIVAAFDSDPGKVGITSSAKPVLSVEDLHDYCNENDVKIGIITVPGEHAQNACNLLVKAGIKAIWNFAPVHLNVCTDILVQNENMAASLALLFNHLRESGLS